MAASTRSTAVDVAWTCGSPTLSPDGAAVAYVSDRDGVPRVWVQPLRGAGPRVIDTGPEPVADVLWSPDGEWLAVKIAPGGGEHTQVWAVRPDGSGLRLLAGPVDGPGSAAFVRWTGHGATLLLAELGPSGTAEAVLADPALGHRDTIAKAPLLWPVAVSRDHGRALLRHGPRGGRYMTVADLRDGGERPLLPPTTDLGALSPDGEIAYVRSDAGRDRAALVAVPGGEAPRVVAERPDADLDRFSVSLDGRVAVLAWNVAGRSELDVVSLPTGAVRALPRPPADVVTSVRVSYDGTLAVLAAQSPDTPSHVLLCDLATGGYQRLAGDEPLAGGATAELVRLTARDGLELTGWLHRAGTGPGPCLIYLHGGPESQERPAFNPLFHRLVAAGVSVFAPNVRGSSGFGKAFLHADDHALRFHAIDDVADCAAHMVRTGVADPARLACMGRSYGGYLTLAALVTYPELFKAGVDVCGMADFATFYAHTEPWIAAAAVGEYGDPVADRELLRALSPLHSFDRLRAPLLVVHGAQDTNVPVYEAEQVVAAATARGVPCRYLLFEDEGHETVRIANKVVFWDAVTGWLGRWLTA
ncbi:peptidase S9 [Sphaerisporangium siamense]|uniref:Dipeptidyl aminopeptidase/acylaminoacyl peptidase n=1 Tax=Sphaerisporangium siamense TaxID=795645 RepID=A0A7W7DEV1_9ACTN|nr:prolyl oligopeptidase family serine peptidase [Sphaerisporangium siamense]MBB4705507.1 dipeptidyl aminopeptidase/acylaminoacyl peptidase [Sphaerisporangium siamense]GII83115.1 peptidase S9 [Sphaerisporangium siamense]